MSKGKIVYFGPGKEMVHYFSSIGHECPKYSNPADFASTWTVQMAPNY